MLSQKRSSSKITLDKLKHQEDTYSQKTPGNKDANKVYEKTGIKIKLINHLHLYHATGKDPNKDQNCYFVILFKKKPKTKAWAKISSKNEIDEKYKNQWLDLAAAYALSKNK